MARLDMKLIALVSHGKKPLRDFAWKGHYLVPEAAYKMIQAGLNIGVVAGPSDLVILDCDMDNLGPLTMGTKFTLTSRTPNGYQFFLRGPYDEKAGKRLKKRFAAIETIRQGEMYGIAPFSETCKRDHAGGCPPICSVSGHEYRVRVWLDSRLKPMPLKEFAEVLP